MSNNVSEEYAASSFLEELPDYRVSQKTTILSRMMA
jgi:hypothetical protein